MDRKRQTANHTVSPSSSPGDGVSQRAYRALHDHAEMFTALGMSAVDRHGDGLTLADDRLLIDLGYRLRRKLLSRIYHLQIKMDITSFIRRQMSPYQLNLKVHGVARISRYLDATGAGAEEGAKIGGRLLAAGVVEELAKGVDLENLSISWQPEMSNWEVTVEPYPGSYVYTVFPPMTYSVKLKDSEAKAIRNFLVVLSDMMER